MVLDAVYLAPESCHHLGMFRRLMVSPLLISVECLFCHHLLVLACEFLGFVYQHAVLHSVKLIFEPFAFLKTLPPKQLRRHFPVYSSLFVPDLVQVDFSVLLGHFQLDCLGFNMGSRRVSNGMHSAFHFVEPKRFIFRDYTSVPYLEGCRCLLLSLSRQMRVRSHFLVAYRSHITVQDAVHNLKRY